MTIPTGGMPPPIDDELLSAYLDGQVSPAERAAVDAAIAADPAARAHLADLRATVTLLRTLPQPAPRRTFILTPEQAAAIRPARVAWVTRLFPTVAAASAVAAVLCLMLVAGDLATGGFSSRRQTAAVRPAIESVAVATTTRITRAAVAPTTAPAATTAAAILPVGTTAAASAATTAPPAPAAVAANVSAPAPAGAASSARGSGAPVVGAAVIAPTATGRIILTVPPFTPTAGSFAASNGALPATATLVANVQAAPPVVSAAPPGGATVTTESHRVPVALVRAGEILLALLAVAGVTLAVLGRRAKSGRL